MRHLLLSGGPGHDFDETSAVLVELFGDLGAMTTIVEEPAETIAAIRSAEASTTGPWDLVTVNALRWSMNADRFADQRDRWAVELAPGDAEVLARHVDSGGGLLALHAAVICFDAHPVWHDLLGASWQWDRSGHPPVGPVSITPTRAGHDHPITAGLDGFELTDELYGDLDLDDVTPLLVGTQAGTTHPVLWARKLGRGRVVTSLLGHGTASLSSGPHRELLVRAARWATGATPQHGGTAT